MSIKKIIVLVTIPLVVIGIFLFQTSSVNAASDACCALAWCKGYYWCPSLPTHRCPGDTIDPDCQYNSVIAPVSPLSCNDPYCGIDHCSSYLSNCCGNDICEPPGETYSNCSTDCPSPSPTPTPIPSTPTPSPTPIPTGCLNGVCYQGGTTYQCTSWRECTGCSGGYSRVIQRYGGINYTCLYNIGSCDWCDPACGCPAPTAVPNPTRSPSQGCIFSLCGQSACQPDQRYVSGDCHYSWYYGPACYYDTSCENDDDPVDNPCPVPPNCNDDDLMFFEPANPQPGQAFTVNILSKSGYCYVGLDVTRPSNPSGVEPGTNLMVLGADSVTQGSNYRSLWVWSGFVAETGSLVTPYLFEFNINNRSQYCVSRPLFIERPIVPQRAWMQVVGGDVHSNK